MSPQLTVLTHFSPLRRESGVYSGTLSLDHVLQGLQVGSQMAGEESQGTPFCPLSPFTEMETRTQSASFRAFQKLPLFLLPGPQRCRVPGF